MPSRSLASEARFLRASTASSAPCAFSLESCGDLAGGLGDFAGGSGLLGGGGGDEVDLVLDLLGGLDDRLEAVAGAGGLSHAGFDGGAAFLHDFESLAGLFLNAADGAGDLFGGALGALGQAANLAGDDGKSAAMLAGAGGLDGRVQGQQVGLLADLLNHVDDLADLLGAMGQRSHLFGDGAGGGGDFFHGGGGGLHHRAALIGGFGRFAAGGGGALGVVADLADGRGHLLRRGGNLVGLAGLGVGVAGALHGAGADFGGGRGERFRALSDGFEHGAHGVDAGVEGHPEAADLVGAGDADIDRKVFVGHGFDGVLEPVDTGSDFAGKDDSGQDAKQQHEQRRTDIDPNSAAW